MERNEQRLCGGTLFTLMLEAKKQRTNANEHLRGDTDNLTVPKILVGFIRVVVPDYREPQKKETFKTNATEYRFCEKTGNAYIPFDKEYVLDSFDELVKENYSDALNRMACFADDFLDVKTSTKGDLRLVKALLDLVDADETVNEDQVFHIGQSGEAVAKKNFTELSNICFQSFLLGVFHFALCERRDNTVGKETAVEWCPAAGGGKRVYKGTLGNDIDREIKLFYCKADSENQPTQDQGEAEPELDDAAFFAEEDKPDQTNQVLNINPSFISIKGNVQNYYEKPGVVINNCGGGSDEQ